MTLADRIKDARIRAGLSQAELARRSGISQPSLHDLESGKSKTARSTTLVHLAEALGQTPEWLAGGKGASLTTSTRTAAEEALLSDFRRLNSSEKRVVVRMIRALVIDK